LQGLLVGSSEAAYARRPAAAAAAAAAASYTQEAALEIDCSFGAARTRPSWEDRESRVKRGLRAHEGLFGGAAASSALNPLLRWSRTSDLSRFASGSSARSSSLKRHADDRGMGPQQKAFSWRSCVTCGEVAIGAGARTLRPARAAALTFIVKHGVSRECINCGDRCYAIRWPPRAPSPP